MLEQKERRMETPLIPGDGASHPEDTPLEEFADEEDMPAGSVEPGVRSDEAAQRPTGSGGSAPPVQSRDAKPPE
jgi:hypothetical protein